LRDAAQNGSSHGFRSTGYRERKKNKFSLENRIIFARGAKQKKNMLGGENQKHLAEEKKKNGVAEKKHHLQQKQEGGRCAGSNTLFNENRVVVNIRDGESGG